MIEVENLTKHYSALAAIEDGSFTLEEDEILGFPEPDAADRSATVRIPTALARVCDVSPQAWPRG